MAGKRLTAVLDFFFPPKCVFCRALLPSGEHEICCACRLDLPIYQDLGKRGTYFSEFTAVFYYEGVVRDSLRRFKFGGMTQYVPCYAQLMAAAVTGKLKGPFDLVSWCPVSRKRRRKRGYDQAALLAGALAAALALPAVGVLRKKRNNPAQSSLGGAEVRRANVLGVYEVPDGAAVAGKRILLVDDIATTGSTLQEASRILLTAGALDVGCAVLAATREQ